MGTLRSATTTGNKVCTIHSNPQNLIQQVKLILDMLQHLKKDQDGDFRLWKEGKLFLATKIGTMGSNLGRVIDIYNGKINVWSSTSTAFRDNKQFGGFMWMNVYNSKDIRTAILANYLFMKGRQEVFEKKTAMFKADKRRRLTFPGWGGQRLIN